MVHPVVPYGWGVIQADSRSDEASTVGGHVVCCDVK